jgi:ATP-dependent Lon protease
MAGRIVREIREAQTMNPVVLLDEVDKMGVDMLGDPAAALLEVLDPEQNGTFQDHYLDVPYDLSQVTFLCTANNPDTIPPALWDRMEVIDCPGYTRAEKLNIAKDFLCPKQLSAHGMTDERLDFTRDGLERIIDSYTREAGVRNLEREIGAVCRSLVMRIAEGEANLVLVADGEAVERILGPPRYMPDLAERTSSPGVVTGLAWTPSGGDILFIECTSMPGKGQVLVTGNLKSVMSESAATAVSYVRSHAKDLGLDVEFLKKMDLHLHVPKGGTPKDGPSAGVTMFTALVSMLTGVRVRHDVAMTGEITLRGRVLPIGGLKEKVLAAHRAGIKRVLVPERNKPDLDEVPAEVKNDLEFVFVSKMDQVLEAALEDKLVPKAAESAAVPAPVASSN